MSGTNFTASNGESRNPFYEGQFDGETYVMSVARRHWATAASELAKAQSSQLAQDFPPLGGLTECDMGDSYE